jgi:hypothetical protein
VKLWKVPASKDKLHGLKYSLVYIREGKKVIGYDNAEGGGDHRHHGQKEYRYQFRDVDSLIEDFVKDVDSLRRGKL